MGTALSELLETTRLTEVVDIGANPIDGDPPYKPMLDAGLCKVTGFEPQEEALAELMRTKGPNETYLPYAVGDGGIHTLHICEVPGMTSLLEPDPAPLDLFNLFANFGKVVRQVEVETRRLDEIAEIVHLDFLKIDIQGGELMVFQSGQAKLTSAVAIQTEVSFIALYKDQPTVGDVDVELRRQGFVPHCFAELKNWAIRPSVFNNEPRLALNQVLEADLVYVRDIVHAEHMSDEQLKHLALIAHHCYYSFDLALRCLTVLEERGALAEGVATRYLSTLDSEIVKEAIKNALVRRHPLRRHP